MAFALGRALRNLFGKPWARWTLGAAVVSILFAGRSCFNGNRTAPPSGESNGIVASAPTAFSDAPSSRVCGSSQNGPFQLRSAQEIGTSFGDTYAPGTRFQLADPACAAGESQGFCLVKAPDGVVGYAPSRFLTSLCAPTSVAAPAVVVEPTKVNVIGAAVPNAVAPPAVRGGLSPEQLLGETMDEASRVTAPFSKTAAIATLAGAAASAGGCTRTQGPTGTGKVQVTFANNGRVTRAVVLGPPFAGTPRGACVEASFAGAHVPAFGGNPVTVSKTFLVQQDRTLPAARCSKDSDCQGDLLCEAGRCVGSR